MKGISAVIATLLMLVITVALAITAYGFISGTFEQQTSQTFDLVDAICDTTNDEYHIVLRNTDQFEDIDVTEFLISIDSVPAPVDSWDGTVGGGGFSSTDYQIFEGEGSPPLAYSANYHSSSNCRCLPMIMCARNTGPLGNPETVILPSFPLSDGEYDVVVKYCDEEDDNSGPDMYRLLINGNPVNTWQTVLGNPPNTWKNEMSTEVIMSGDQVMVESTRNDMDTFTRIDYIEFTGTGNIVGGPGGMISANSGMAVANIDGTSPGSHRIRIVGPSGRAQQVPVSC